MLTKRQSIELCLELWQWLADHPKAGKNSWPEWKRPDVLEIGPDIECECFACHYGMQQAEKNEVYTAIGYPDKCKYCPLKTLWPYYLNGHGAPCESVDSPYYTWVENDYYPAIRKQAAKRIADFLKQLLEKGEL